MRRHFNLVTIYMIWSHTHTHWFNDTLSSSTSCSFLTHIRRLLCTSTDKKRGRSSLQHLSSPIGRKLTVFQCRLSPRVAHPTLPFSCLPIQFTPLPPPRSTGMPRVGQSHIYTAYIWFVWQGNHQIYGHIRCIYTVLTNPEHVHKHILNERLCCSALFLNRHKPAIVEAHNGGSP
jgi:hypothetical protein